MEASGSTDNGPAAPLGISCLSAPVQAADIQAEPVAVGMQASTSKTQDSTVAHTDLSSHPAATAQLKSAVSNVAGVPASRAAAAGSQQGQSQGQGLPGAAGSQQRQVETAADGVNSLYYNMGTADRPLSSFAQRGGPTGAARPAGGGSRTAASEHGGTSYMQQGVEAEAGASMALVNAPAAGKQIADGILASAAALAGTEMMPGQHQEGYSPEPFHTAGQPEQGYSAAAPSNFGHSGLYQESFSEAPHQASPLQSPDNKPNQAEISPRESMLPLEGRDGMQAHPVSDTGLSPHPAQWHTEYGPESIQHPATGLAGAAGHAVTADRQQPTLGYDAGHVAIAPAVMGGFLPGLTGLSALGHDVANSSQSRGPATAARLPNLRTAEGDVGIASPSGFSSSFLGQSLDLSKVSCLV